MCHAPCKSAVTRSSLKRTCSRTITRGTLSDQYVCLLNPSSVRLCVIRPTACLTTHVSARPKNRVSADLTAPLQTHSESVLQVFWSTHYFVRAPVYSCARQSTDICSVELSICSRVRSTTRCLFVEFGARAGDRSLADRCVRLFTLRI